MRRCFRYEYLIKTLLIFGGFILNMLYFGFIYHHFPLFSIFFFVSIPILFIYYIRITIQRCHDLGLSGAFAFIRAPIVSEFILFNLFFKKGDRGINEYDEAINYKKYLNRKHCIDIYDKMFIINNEEYNYERYMKKYSIRVSGYEKRDVFIEYLIKNYPSKEERIHRTGNLFKTIEIAEDEFNDLIGKMDFIIIKNSIYVKIKDFEVFIRRENFKYTIILDKNINNISKESLCMLKIPGQYFEDEEYIIYNKINKDELLIWIKYVA